MNNPTSQAFRDEILRWIRDNTDATSYSIDFDFEQCHWVLVLDGDTYFAPFDSDDDDLAFYRPDQVHSDDQENILIELDDLLENLVPSRVD